MRISELAKVISQKYNFELKAGELLREFKTLPEFAEISDQLKMHSSSVDDKHVRLMMDLYQQRLGPGNPEPKAAEAAPPKPAPRPNAPNQPLPTIKRPQTGIRPTASATALPARPQPTAAPVPPKPTAPLPPPARPAAPKPVAAPLPPSGGLPRPAPLPTPGARPAAIPAVRRPQPIGSGQPAPARPAPAAPAPTTPVQARTETPGATDSPKMAIAPAAPVAPAPRPLTPTPAPLRPSGTAPAAPPIARGPGAPSAPGQRPAPAGQPRRDERRPDPSRGGDRPRGDRPQGGPQGERPGQKFRPTGLATELRSSSGTTGFTATPDRRGAPAARGGAGQPAAPSMPKFSTDSPFLKPQRRPEEARPEGRRGEGRPSEGGRGGATGDRRGAKPGSGPAAPLTEILTVPEIGVMKLKAKTGGAPGRGGHKKKGDKDSEAAKAKKKLIPSKVYGDADEFRRPIKLGGRKRPGGPSDGQMMRREPAEVKPVGPIILTGPVTVAEFAERLGITTAELIKKAFLKGKAITINQLINFELAEEIAIEMDIDVQVKPEGDESDLDSFRTEADDNPADYVARPPVVTIMGHVDHGKTTILDYYRRSRVVEGEFGGITQHIGAYQVETQRGTIVFLDTPGHEAFTAMRARGVKATDIVVLVVSADDGVMPQTIEAINHAKAANVPLIVAINKIDLPQANPERVRTELLQYQVLSTALGGDTEFVEVSAKQGTNMDALLEIISLQAEVLELKSNPKRLAEGIVIESHVDPLRGSVATLLVQQGTLNVGDVFVVGQQYGRVRAMYDDRGRMVRDANLARPVELIGLTGAPETGEILLEMPDEQTARDIAEKREQRRRLLELGTTRHVSLEGLHDMIADGQIRELNVILKADVQGSLEAIVQALDKVSANEIRVRVLHSGTGPINEGDINLAAASQAVVIGFNIRPESRAEELAQREGIQIKTYRIIYELLEDMEKALVGMLEKKFTEQTQGRAEVRQVFRVTKVGTIAGCMVSMGEIIRGAQARLIRDNAVVYEGKIGSLRRVKEDVTKVNQGFECGIGLDRFGDVKEGDIIETFTMQEVAAELTRA